MGAKTLTIEECRSIFEYIDGVVYWKERPLSHFKRPKDYKTWATKCKGKPSGQTNENNYRFIKIFIRGRYEIYREHWVVWAICNGEWPTEQIDHIDHNPANNKIENLRLADNQENRKNRGIQKNNKSGVNGVFWNKATNCWRASIQVGGKARHIGLFKDLEEAKKARSEKEREFGFHPNHGKNI